jgi:hypothetical protein
MLLSVNTSASFIMRKRHIARVWLRVDLLDTLLREDHDTSISCRWDMLARNTISKEAPVPLLNDWLPGLLTGALCGD